MESSRAPGEALMAARAQLYATVAGDEVLCVADQEFHPGVRLVPQLDGVALRQCIADHVLVTDGLVTVRDDTMAGRPLWFPDYVEITNLGDAEGFLAA